MKWFTRILAMVLITVLTFTYQPLTTFAAIYDDDADDIKYSIDSNKTLDFDEDKFNDACDELTGEELDYVKFKLPDEDEGVLYYDYDEDEDDNTKVSTSRKYYFDSSPYIKRVTFVPDEDFSGTVSIKYTGYNEDGDSYSGKIKITVKGKSSASDTISYTMSYKKDYIQFDEDDFFKICKSLQSQKLDYVKFTLPDDDDGILYYDYDEDNVRNSTKVSASRKYYYDDSPYLSKVYFVPDEDFSGTITIKYKGYDSKGNDFSGKIKIKVGNDDEDSSDTITYKIANNSEVIKFDEDDFTDLCEDLKGKDLDFVKFTIPSASKGVLYYNYKNGQYASVVTSSKKYYIDSDPYIGDVTFAPHNQFSGTCIIKFDGWDVKGGSFSGEVAVTVGSGNVNAKTISYMGTAETATIMKDSDFNSVCRELMNSQLDCVSFTLPASSSGTLYYGYTQDGNYSAKVREGTKYYYDGSPYLLNVSFVPAKGFNGTVAISYTGYAVSGLSFTGTVQVSSSGAADGSGSETGSGSGTTPTNPATLVSSKHFKDVTTDYSWAVPYIDALYESGIIAGTATVGGSKLYNPATPVTRGDFMLVLYRAMNLKTSSTANKVADVPSDSYYYDAIMTARALGIAQGSDNYFYPTTAITREDAMVFVLRAVNITGTTIPSADVASLSSYSDNSSISDYSRSAVAALIKAGIITGSDDNHIYPQGNLTRSQIAAIVYRVINR